MSALSNRRTNPRTGAVSWRTMDTETRTVAEFDELPGIYGFQLQDRPRQGTVVITEDVTGGATFDIVTTDPLPGQVFVDFDFGYCVFHVDDDATICTIDYEGGGSNANIVNIQSIASVPTSSEIAAQTELTTLDESDEFLINDTSASETKKIVAQPFIHDGNLIINGNIEIDQENIGSVTGVTDASYTADQWRIGSSHDGAVDYAQSSTVPDDTSQNSLLLTVTTQDTSIGASQRFSVQQPLEGYNYFPFHNGQSMMLSFWVRSSLTGTYTIGLQNGAGNRSYAQEYTINTANTFEYKTIQFETDTTGTWNFTNGTGVFIIWNLAAGSNFHGSNDTWQASGTFSTANQVNWLGTNGNTFYLSQVKLEPGPVATPFVPRQFENEFVLCKRYYEKSYDLTTSLGAATSTGAEQHMAASTLIRESFDYISKRVTPTITLYAADSGTSGNIRNRSTGSDVAASAGDIGLNRANVLATVTDAQQHAWHWVSDARF